jgi:hypothetical protein
VDDPVRGVLTAAGGSVLAAGSVQGDWEVSDGKSQVTAVFSSSGWLSVQHATPTNEAMVRDRSTVPAATWEGSGRRPLVLRLARSTVRRSGSQVYRNAAVADPKVHGALSWR